MYMYKHIRIYICTVVCVNQTYRHTYSRDVPEITYLSPDVDELSTILPQVSRCKNGFTSGSADDFSIRPRLSRITRDSYPWRREKLCFLSSFFVFPSRHCRGYSRILPFRTVNAGICCYFLNSLRYDRNVFSSLISYLQSIDFPCSFKLAFHSENDIANDVDIA